MDGIFASMWADQVSGSDTSPDDVPHELAGYSLDVQEEEHAGVDSPAPADTAIDIPATVQEDHETQQQGNQNGEAQARTEVDATPVSIPQEEAGEKDRSEVPPISSPALASPPVTFPSSDPEAPAPKSPVPAGVTFEPNVTDSPRTGTPDPDSEPKRKRISSQNFQRLARKISITTRRQGSVSSLIPGLKRDSSPRVSTDDGAGGSVRGEGSTHDSPTPSLTDKGNKTKKKDKKEKDKKRKSLI